MTQGERVPVMWYQMNIPSPQLCTPHRSPRSSIFTKYHKQKTLFPQRKTQAGGISLQATEAEWPGSCRQKWSESIPLLECKCRQKIGSRVGREAQHKQPRRGQSGCTKPQIYRWEGPGLPTGGEPGFDRGKLLDASAKHPCGDERSCGLRACQKFAERGTRNSSSEC